jgi:uncharacterized membrane protein YsdA (DUF1294 family)
MPIRDLNGPIWFALVSLVIYLFDREKTKQRMHVQRLIHEERLKAIEKGLPYPELPPYQIEEATESHGRSHWKPTARQVVGMGLIAILGGAGAALAMKLSPEDYHQRAWSFGFVPVFVGVGMLLYAWINRRDME